MDLDTTASMAKSSVVHTNTPLESIKTLSFATITSVLASRYEFPKLLFDAEGTNSHGNQRWPICGQ